MLNVLDDARLGPLVRRARCVFFDCDGVIFDSNGFKIRAMRSTLAAHSADEVARMEEFWRANGGASRFVKFEHFYTHIAPAVDVASAVRTAAESFGRLSLSAYETVAPLPEALELARRLGPSRCHVVSGAAEVELHQVFAAKGIAPSFATIQGSPRPKLELVRKVLSESSCSSADALLIGDGAMDYRVSRELGLHFIYLAQFSEWSAARETLAGGVHVSLAETWCELLRALTAPIASARPDAL